MKTYLLLILLICTTLQSQTTFSQTSGKQLDYFKTNPKELLDKNGNNLFNSNDFDTLILNGDSISNNFGYSVSSAGDVNGDGFSDVIVGLNINSFPNERWRAFIYFGGLKMDTIADVILTGELHSYIMSVTTAGDVNGDGFSDILLGVEGNGLFFAYIYLGGESMDTTADFSYIASHCKAGDCPSFSVSTAGDVNGDGYSDVIIGYSGYLHEFWPVYGSTVIFYGGSILDNQVDVLIEGLRNCFDDCYYQISVSTAGDVNGDGFSDVIVGTSNFDGYNGITNIYYGGINMNNTADVTMTSNNYFGNSVSTAGDVNGDGFSDIIVGEHGNNSSTGSAYIYYGSSIMNNIVDVTMTGEAINNKFGISVSNAGDVNGDGYSDVIVGASQYSSFTGRVYIFYGGVSMNNTADVIMTGESQNNAFGISVSSAGDVNGDGYSDVIVGANEYSNSIGRAYIYITNPAIIKINVKVLMEGMYIPIFNKMTRRDTVTAYLHQSTPPYNKIDSAKSVIDSNTFLGLLNFINASAGTYYIAIKHFNCIETWSKIEGDTLINNGSIYNYDFTASESQAYGSNLKLRGGKYCIYSGDVNQDGVIDALDFGAIDNDLYNFRTGRFLPADLNGDNFVDALDITIGDNNHLFIGVIRP